ncbi:DUF2520 domain-containing protein [bacterium]|nr:DUF2520 domain-containing protein [candidate division CSSED10-310 bacterium]
MFGKAFCIIGLGRVGSVFARELKRAGFIIRGMIDLENRKTENILATLGIDSISTDITVIPECDIIVIAVGDNELPGFVRNLRDASRFKENTLVVHTSGNTGVDILKPLERDTISIGAIHPIMAFPGDSTIEKSFKNAWFGIRGDSRAIRLLSELVNGFGGYWIRVPESCRFPYHIAMVLCSNFVIALELSALELMKSCGLPESDSVRLLRNMTRDALMNLDTDDPLDALTGPLVRKDSITIRSHIEFLESNHPELLDLYRIMSRRIIDILRRKSTHSGDTWDLGDIL